MSMKIKTGHTEPIDFYLKRPDGTVYDASGMSSAQAKGRIKGKITSTFTNSLTVISDGTDGGVRMSPAADDFAAKGTYEIEVKVNGADGVVFAPDPFIVFCYEAFD